MRNRFLKLSFISSVICLVLLVASCLVLNYSSHINNLEDKLIRALEVYDKTGYISDDIEIVKNPESPRGFLEKNDYLVKKTSYHYSMLINIDNDTYLVSTIYPSSINTRFVLVTSFVFIIILIINYNISLKEMKSFKKFLDSSTRLFGNGKTYDDPIFDDRIREDFRHLSNLSNNLKDKVKELDNERAKLDKIISNMSQGIILLDGLEQVILLNDNAKKMLNLKDNLVGKDFLNELNDNYLLSKISDFSLSDDTSLNFSYDKYDLEGLIYDFNLIKVKEGWIDDITHQGYLIVITDVTDNFITNKIRTDFIQNASHELKTPITSIRGYSELLMENLVSEEMLQSIYTKINYNAIKMSNLISDILDLSKLERSSVSLRLEEVDLNSLVKEILDNLASRIEEKHLEVRLSGNLVLLTDKNILSIVLRNIISNAIKYNKEYGYIEISLSDKKIKIKDSGIGISKENQDRIFERFYRVNHDVSGTGLGLSIVKHSLGLLDAKIIVDSKLNEYTSFSIFF